MKRSLGPREGSEEDGGCSGHWDAQRGGSGVSWASYTGVTFFSGLGFMLRNFIFPVNKSVPLKHFFKAGSDKKISLVLLMLWLFYVFLVLFIYFGAACLIS